MASGIAARYLENLAKQNGSDSQGPTGTVSVASSPLKPGSSSKFSPVSPLKQVFPFGSSPSKYSPSKNSPTKIPSSPTKSSSTDVYNDTTTTTGNTTLLGELVSFQQRRRNNEVSLKKVNKEAKGTAPVGNQGYEYLCRIAECKQFIEDCIQEEIPSTLDLANKSLRDGIALVKFTKHFMPELVPKSFNKKLNSEYVYMENIECFLHFITIIGVGEDFLFDATDLYELKNIPKVILSLYYACFLLSKEPNSSKLQNLVGKIHFNEIDIKNQERVIKRAKVSIPNESSCETYFYKKQLDFIQEEDDQLQDEILNSNEQILEQTGYFDGDITQDLYNNSYIQHEKSIVENPDYYILQSFHDMDNSFDYTKHDEAADMTVIQHRTTIDNKAELDKILRSVIIIQSISRGFLSRYKVFIKKTLLNMYEGQIIELQSVIRKQLFFNKASRYLKKIKYSSTKKAKDLMDSEDSIIELQSQIRAVISRRRLQRILKTLRKSRSKIVQFQSIIRGEIYRFRLDSSLLKVDDFADQISALQAHIRGTNLRTFLDKNLNNFATRFSEIDEFQAYIRGSLLRKHLNRLFQDISLPSLIEFQSTIRGNKLRIQVNVQKSMVEYHDNGVKKLQSKIRGNFYRTQFKNNYYVLNQYKDIISSFQSISRGVITRRRIVSNVITKIFNSEILLNDFNAKIRGFLLRKNFLIFKEDLKSESQSIIELQSVIKGHLCRLRIEFTLANLRDYDFEISEIQGKFRGIAIRKQIFNMLDYYQKNIEKVIRCQSYIRAYNQNDAYNQLINTKNPSLNVIRQFSYLLNDTFKDFDEEVKLENLNHRILMKSQQNADLEKHCNELDGKIELLVKNKLTLDELIQHKNKYLGLDFAEFKKKVLISTKPTKETLGKVKSSTSIAKDNKYEVFESLLYVLQTCPEYFVRMFRAFNNRANSKAQLQQIVLACFNISNIAPDVEQENNHTKIFSLKNNYMSTMMQRNEFLFTNLLISAISDQLSSMNVLNIDEFKLDSSNVLWRKLLFGYMNTRPQKFLAKQIFGGLITRISEIDNLSMQTDPLLIYQDLIMQEELESGLRSKKPAKITVQEALKDPETRQQYIDNLDLIRDWVFNVLSVLEDNIEVLPKYIRSICYRVFHTVKTISNEEQAYVFALNMLLENYVTEIIGDPEKYEIPLVTFSTNEAVVLKNNLGYLCKVLLQISSLSEFSLQDTYYGPLNGFVSSCFSSIKSIMNQVMSSGDLESIYKTTIYHDLSLRAKPTLILKKFELSDMKDFILKNKNIISPSPTDPILEYINLLETASVSSTSKVTVKLFLNPSVTSFSGVKTKTLFLDAKRCLLYMMRVQPKEQNLFSLLTSDITKQDEIKFQQILYSEREEAELTNRRHENKYGDSIHNDNSIIDFDDDVCDEAKNQFSKSAFFKDISSMDYRRLKVRCLEVVQQLENMEKITRRDNFQVLLNDIGLDIKFKHDQRIKRKKQISIASQALTSLDEKESYLENLMSTYRKYIHDSVNNLQELTVQKKKAVKSKNKFLLPFRKQYYYQWALKRRGKVPHFGSYRYSSKYLHERGILLSISGARNLDMFKADFVFSCDIAGIFQIEIIRKNDAGSGALSNLNNLSKVTLDELLQYQYEGKSSIDISNGFILFDTINLLTFIFKKFYDNHGGNTKKPKSNIHNEL